MLLTLPLDQMSIREKLQIMEQIWDDLCRNAGKIDSPDWHEDILKEREKAVENGTDSFTDWETAKRNIRKSVSVQRLISDYEFQT